MRPLDETRKRWQATLTECTSLANVQRAVRYNGVLSPCVAGLRSVCWKLFLVLKDVDATKWPAILAAARSDHAEKQAHFLRFIRHPDQLADVDIDPLTDDPNSPWNTLRQDEVIRAEILQDVRRLPDEPFYHEQRIQQVILDLLFLYCKLNPDRGGYRQGMHELLAPIVYVVFQDAVDRAHLSPDAVQGDAQMLDVLDLEYAEHDSFLLFSKVMESAGHFYEIREDPISAAAAALSPRSQSNESSVIVEKSRHIHEVCLFKVDPELSTHLKNIEILPQIFLIRWIRLLFGREFPFDELLALWDTIFAVDPTLELIDIVCVAMLLRIRWELLEADYSVCLQLLLKYPAPQPPHGPQTFVDDALYLRDHLTQSGAASLLMKYTGKLPEPFLPTTPEGSRPGATVKSPKSRPQQSPRPPIPSPARFLQQHSGNVEALFQGAAKNVLERGEKLGINQAVRDAMVEIKRNVQHLQENRYPPRPTRGSSSHADEAVAALELRNRQLAVMLDDAISNLRSISPADLEDQVKSLELIELVAAKVQFVKVFLEDSTIPVDVPVNALTRNEVGTPSANAPASPKKKPTVVPDTIIPAIASLNIAPSTATNSQEKSSQAAATKLVAPTPPATADAMDTTPDAESQPSPDPATSTVPNSSASTPPIAPQPLSPHRPRASLASPSFSWILEPDPAMILTPSSPTRSHRKKPSGSSPGVSGATRAKNAFLFGEVTADEVAGDVVQPDEIFGLEPLARRRVSGRRSGEGKDGKPSVEDLF